MSEVLELRQKLDFQDVRVMELEAQLSEQRTTIERLRGSLREGRRCAEYKRDHAITRASRVDAAQSLESIDAALACITQKPKEQP